MGEFDSCYCNILSEEIASYEANLCVVSMVWNNATITPTKQRDCVQILNSSSTIVLNKYKQKETAISIFVLSAFLQKANITVLIPKLLSNLYVKCPRTPCIGLKTCIIYTRRPKFNAAQHLSVLKL